MVAAPSRTHRTQAERSERTREQLLTATIDCLLDLGYAGTTMNEVCRRAGLSRGAQQHHFATKAELMTHALEYLVVRLGETVTAELGAAAATAGSAAERIELGVDLLWRAFSGTLSTAAMELWVAARTDPELRATLLPVDRALGRATFAVYRGLLGADLSAERLDTLYWLTLTVTRGLATDAMIGGEEARRTQLLAEWKRMAVALLAD
jgi:AcrR family transcriptional regulator